MITIGIVFFIYLAMAFVTRVPQLNEVIAVDDAIDVVYITSKQTSKLITQSKNNSIQEKLKKPTQLNQLKNGLVSDVNSEINDFSKTIDRENMVQDFSTELHKETPSPQVKMNLAPLELKALYPYEAYRNKINGWVLLKLFISKTGIVVDVVVLDSSPKGIFETAAIKAAYKKEFPINKDDPDPKEFTRNIFSKYNADPNFL